MKKRSKGGANIPDTIADPLDLERLGYTDPKVFDLYVRGDTVGVFQFESEECQRLLKDMRPDRLEDLIAASTSSDLVRWT